MFFNQKIPIIKSLFKFSSLTSQQLLLIVNDKAKQAIYQNLNKLISKKLYSNQNINSIIKQYTT